MKVQTKGKAGRIVNNHNQTAVKAPKVKSGVKSGYISHQHNQTLVRAVRVKSGVKAGLAETPGGPHNVVKKH